MSPEFRRLGTQPDQRLGADRSMLGGTCPDVILDGDGDRVIVIGRLLDGLPEGAPGTVGPGEAVVSLPFTVFLDAALELVADGRLAASEAEGQQQRVLNTPMPEEQP